MVNADLCNVRQERIHSFFPCHAGVRHGCRPGVDADAVVPDRVARLGEGSGGDEQVDGLVAGATKVPLYGDSRASVELVTNKAALYITLKFHNRNLQC